MSALSKPRRAIVAVCLASLALVVLIAAVIWQFLPAILLTPRQYSEPQMWRIVHEWTQTAPLPGDASDVSIITEGSDFTRQFKAHFRLSSESLKAWIAASPGFRDAQVTNDLEGVRHYLIKPGGGALFAEIVIDERTGSISI